MTEHDGTDTPDQHEDRERGTDTPTGTDPDAEYSEPGYEDKSLGQAVDQDQELAERIAEESDDEDEAAQRFERESTGAPAREAQGRPETG